MPTASDCAPGARNPRWRYRLIFKNQGERAGATFEHAHAQLIALPFVPADVANELANASAVLSA